MARTGRVLTTEQGTKKVIAPIVTWERRCFQCGTIYNCLPRNTPRAKFCSVKCKNASRHHEGIGDVLPPLRDLPRSDIEWRVIPGWENYEASSNGMIRMANVMELAVTIKRIRNGVPYRCVNLRIGINARKEKKIAPLVCAAFHGRKPDPKLVSRHLDGDSLNDVPSNLSWGTYQQNSDDRERHGRTPRGETHGSAKLNNEKVRQIRKLLSETSLTLTAIGERFDVSRVTIRFIKTGHTWKNLP
jgi:hypothetical protein